MNVCTILGDRLDLSSLQEKQTRDGERIVRTQSGREIRAELVVSSPSTFSSPHICVLHLYLPYFRG